MKKKSLILLFALGSLFTACNDAVDITQPGELNDAQELYQTPQDVERGVNLIYSAIPAETEVEFNSVWTDEVSIGFDNGGQGIGNDGEYRFQMLTGNAWANGLWSSYYFLINRINRMIEVTNELKAKDAANEAAYNTSLFELHALRAYSNLKLFSYYTPSYTNTSGLSIMKLDFVPEGLDKTLGRSTVGEIRDFILKDLNDALTLNASPRTNNQGTFKSYVSFAMIDAMKVKLYAMTENYGQIESLALPIINNSLYSMKGNLANGSTSYNDHPYFIQFMDEENVSDGATDVIFKLRRTLNQGGNVLGAWYSVRAGINGSPFYEMGRALYNALDKLDNTATGQSFGAERNDVRFYVNVHPESEVQTNYETLSQSDYESNDIILVGKYPGRNSAQRRADVPIYRTPDVLLALAEARASQGAFMPAGANVANPDPDSWVGDYSSVYSILYTLRFYRLANTSNFTTISMPAITNSQDAYKAILNERRVEFAFEGQRYLDMKRLGAKAGVSGFDRYTKDCSPYGACSLPIGDHRYTLPIPIIEISANPTIAGQQNPGY